MKIGDLVCSATDGVLGLIAQVEARIDGARSMGEHIYRIFWVDEDDPEDCGPYYVAEVLLTEFGCKDVWITDDLEIISEGR